MNSLWSHNFGISTIEDLNRAVEAGELNDIFAVCEAYQDRRIVEISNEIIKSKRRLVLLAGPSSSGKTSFAKKLRIQLWASGFKPLYIGTDDYFIDRDKVPFGPDGKQDLEAITAVDVELFSRQLEMLLEGKTVDAPVYDFKAGVKIFGEKRISAHQGQIIIIEGIHALNDALTPYFAPEDKFKIYIKPMTQLADAGGLQINPDDVRELRRIVRDSEKRGWTAVQTIDMWPGIMEGERKYITPFKDGAMEIFDSAQPYELAVLKKYACPKLLEVPKEDRHRPEADRLLALLDSVMQAPEDSLIEGDSIIREFIGGSVLV